MSTRDHQALWKVYLSIILAVSTLWMTVPFARGFERTEQREPCCESSALRRPMFGDLQVHASVSFDSYLSSQRNDPDTGYRNVQDHLFDNPGGLAVVWAKANSHDSSFEGMRRRETYATRGTRTVVRFFAGTDYLADMCTDPQMIEKTFAGICADQVACTREAQAEGTIGDVYRKCCLDAAREPFYSPTLQERACTSPI